MIRVLVDINAENKNKHLIGDTGNSDIESIRRTNVRKSQNF